MARQRSFLSLLLVLLATFLISCGSPSVATAPPTYTYAQVQKIQGYLPEIEIVRDRSQELQDLIQKNDWINVGNFIHGPMAEARLHMNYVVPNLLPSDQPKARQIARELFDHLIKIDQAADSGNTLKALSNANAAFADIDNFLNLLPENSTQAKAS
ncbi:photosystem II protein PsbQ [Chlorogloeopsis sp. ULAP02]|uniref:photosystem II protein PsbQ n=1 Tax=Chlorogloeopsis sp. ULAP02 TaxID=3107926 RepID=UPI0031370F08